MIQKHSRLFGYILSILTPISILAISVNLLLTPVTLYVEYNRSNFPPDKFGLEKQDRLKAAAWTLNQIKSANNMFASENQIDIPGTSLIYTTSELSHLNDVYQLLKSFNIIGIISLATTLYISYKLIKDKSTQIIGIKSLNRGGLITIILLVFIGLMLLFAWQSLFIGFHQVFFPQGNWTFAADSTLIRLFPEKFWLDSFEAFTFLVIIMSIILTLVSYYYLKNSTQNPKPNT